MKALRSCQTGLRRLPPWCLSQLATRVDGASLAVFRISFGIVMVWKLVKYLVPVGDTIPLHWFYVDVAWNFPYPGFEWVRPWSEPYLTLHVVVAAVAAMLVAVGFLYRTAAATLFVSYTCIFLWEQADYNNHYYLMCLLSFLLILLPAQTRFSVDAWLHQRRAAQRHDKTDDDSAQASDTTVAFWSVFLLRFQLFVVYFYGGIAKFNADWLTGQPLAGPGAISRQFLCGTFGIEPSAISLGHLCLFLAWGGLVYDLSIGFLLLFRRTRYLALLLTLGFHLHNHFVFPIGVFPAMAFTATLIFLEPDWPLRFAKWLRRPTLPRPDLGWLVGGALALPVVGSALGWKERRSARTAGPQSHGIGRAVAALLVVWVVTQLVFPLRHYWIAGDANWTEEAQFFSWRMMLRSKSAGHVIFHVEDATLMVTDEKGHSRIDWKHWPDDAPRAIHVPVDCQRFDWSHHPGLTVIHEPGLGRRLIYHPSGRSEEDMAAAHQTIVDLWQKKLGRLPVVRETASPIEVLEELRRELEARADDGPGRASLAETLGMIQNAKSLASGPLDETGSLRERRFVQLVDQFAALCDVDDGGSLPWLNRIHPFALQGASNLGERFLVVSDPRIGPADLDQAMWDLSNGEPYVVWFDLSRLRPAAWRQLPLWFVTYERGRLKSVWNYFRELNAHQIERFSVSPVMIHQFAGRIARLWQQQTNRRPAVHVHSYVMLNYRFPQPLIDPTVDLASTEFQLLRHNRWILPLESQRLSDLDASRRTKTR